MTVRTIIVVGRTGAGKSELVKRLITDQGKENQKTPQVSSSMLSCTKHADTFCIPEAIGSGTYHLVDTKGLLDSDKDDEIGVEQLAVLVDKLPTLVGVVYVVCGRMEPTEVEICDFLFRTFFDDVTASRLLVVRTKCSDWKNYDVDGEKQLLRRQGNVPQIIIDAEWQPVDFHPYAPPEDIATMTTRIRRQFAAWVNPLQLAEKFGVADSYIPHHKQIENAQQELNAAKDVLKQNQEERQEMETRMAELQKMSDEDRKAHQQEIDNLTQKLHDSKERDKTMLNTITKMNEDHRATMQAMQEQNAKETQQMMKQMTDMVRSQKRGICSIM